MLLETSHGKKSPPCLLKLVLASSHSLSYKNMYTTNPASKGGKKQEYQQLEETTNIMYLLLDAYIFFLHFNQVFGSWNRLIKSQIHLIVPGVKSLKFHEFKDAIGIGMYH